MTQQNNSDYTSNLTSQQGATSLSALQDQVDDLQQQLTALSKLPTNLETDLNGLFEVVSVAPTILPAGVFDQVKIYTNGSTHRLYIYDWVNRAWHYITFTA